MDEYAVISIARVEDLINKKHQLESRIEKLENHINKLERLLQRACDSSVYEWVTIDKDDIKEIMEVKEEDE